MLSMVDNKVNMCQNLHTIEQRAKQMSEQWCVPEALLMFILHPMIVLIVVNGLYLNHYLHAPDVLILKLNSLFWDYSGKKN